MELLYRLPTLWSEFKNWFLEDEDDRPLSSPPITPVAYFYTPDCRRTNDSCHKDNLVYGDERDYHLNFQFHPVDYKLTISAVNDDEEFFIKFLKRKRKTNISDESVIVEIFMYDSLNCVSALLNNEEAKEIMQLSVNEVVLEGEGEGEEYTALHLAAAFGSYRLTTLFLEKSPDSANTRNSKHLLPLNEAIEPRCPWKNLGNSFLSKIGFLCHHEQRCVLETVRILAHHTRDVQQEFVKYAMEGSALEVATLLLAAPEMFMPSISYLKKQVLERTSLLVVRDVRSAWAYGSDDLSEERMFMEVILVLFELFERSSDKFTAHLRRNMENDEGFQIYDDIRELLEGVGICIDHVDRYVSSLSYRSLSDLISDQQEVSSPNVRKCEGDQMGCVFNKPKVLLYPKGRKLQGELQELTLADPSSALANPLVSQVHRESFSDGTTVYAPEFVKSFCNHPYVEGATKLLEGKSSLINSAKEVGISRLHLPAMSLSPCLVEQYMHHEAWTNVQWNDSNILPYLKMLPLNLALEALCLHQYVTEWTPRKSIFKLIYILCLPEMVEPLKTVELLSSDTAVVQMVASICLQEGEFVRLATLLMTSWDKLVVPDSDVDSSFIGKHVLKELQIVLDQESKSACSKGISLSQFRRKKGALLFAASMLEIFRIARAPLEKYRLSPEVKDILKSEVPLGVSHLLRSLGFHLRREDVDVSDIKCLTSLTEGEHKQQPGMISGGDNRKSHWMEGQNALLMSLERTKEPVPDAFHWRLGPSFKALMSFTPRTFHRHRSMELNDLAADLWQAPGNRLHYVARPLCPIKRIAFAAMTTTRWIKFI